MNDFERLCAVRIAAKHNAPERADLKNIWQLAGQITRAHERRGMLAVLREMREPSFDMVLDGAVSHVGKDDRFSFTPKLVWVAMLDCLIAQAEASESEAEG